MPGGGDSVCLSLDNAKDSGQAMLSSKKMLNNQNLNV